jgi:hypothetical protein
LCAVWVRLLPQILNSKFMIKIAKVVFIALIIILNCFFTLHVFYEYKETNDIYNLIQKIYNQTT